MIVSLEGGEVLQCQVISLINWKGGVGKTTLTHHLGTGLQRLTKAERKKYLGEERFPRVLLIDSDAQCNLSIACLTADHYEDVIYKEGMGSIRQLYKEFLEREDTKMNVNTIILKNAVQAETGRLYENIDLILSHMDMNSMDMNIAIYKKASWETSLVGSAEIYKFQVMHNNLERVKEHYDFIFIDCPPSLNYVSLNAIYASQYYIVPTLLDRLSTYGIQSITNKISEMNHLFFNSADDYEETELLGIVANGVVERNGVPKRGQQRILNGLKELYGETVLVSYMTYGGGITEASELGLPVYAQGDATAQKQSELMMNIVREMLDRV